MHIGRFRRLCVRCGNVAVLRHLIEYDALTVLCCFQTAERRVIVRTVRKACQHRTLREREILHILPEIHMRRGLDAIAALTEIDLVHVHFQDLLLGVLVFDLKSQHHFEQLSFQRLLLREEGIARELLGDGRTALPCRIAARQIRKDCAQDAARIDAMMLIEAHILGRDECILQILRHLRDRHRDAVLFRMDGRDEPSLVIIDARGRIRRDVSCHVRQMARDRHKKSGRRARSCDEADHEEKNQHFLESGSLLRLLPANI